MTAALHHQYLSSDQINGQPDSWWDSVLGVAGFACPPPIDPARAPIAASMTPALGLGGGLFEVWQCASANRPLLSAAALRHGEMRYRYCEEFLFGSLAIEESTVGGGSAALRHATESAYQDIFALLAQTGHRHLVRVWNYLPEINREIDGDERYRHFNAARQAAFRRSGRSTVGSVPAASALGSPAGSPISIYFLAARRAAQMIENPRQTSAYHYPRKFGVHTPTFSRACLLSESTGTTLFVSGTASIVGSETLHRGDAEAQTRETLSNIDALVSEANRRVGAARYSLAGLKLKVYVRHAADLEGIERTLTTSVRASAPVVYLQADVCREELLVEIEATGVAAC